MAPPSPRQLAWRQRIEGALRVTGPLLDLLLAGGERIARAVDRDELDAPAPAPVIAREGARRRVAAGSDA